MATVLAYITGTFAPLTWALVKGQNIRPHLSIYVLTPSMRNLGLNDSMVLNPVDPMNCHTGDEVEDSSEVW